MLILSRRIGESLIIGNNIRVIVAGLHGGQVRVAVDAPDDVKILREELLRQPGRLAVAKKNNP